MRIRALNEFGVRQWTTVLLLLLLGLALIFGLYGRFVGLGLWPYGDDEFYMGRSIDHVLRTGLPRFPCGGFYTRGLSFQYLVALVRLGGFAPEFSGRLVSAVCSLIGLPAAYLIGRRIHGRALGLMVVILLLASVWDCGPMATMSSISGVPSTTCCAPACPVSPAAASIRAD